MVSRIALTAFGVSDGFACSISATVPLTTEAETLVPLRLRYGRGDVAVAPESRYAAAVEYSVLPGVERDSMPTPGATMSGLAR